MTPLQMSLYDVLLHSKDVNYIKNGKQNNVLNVIRHMINICSHPDLIVNTCQSKMATEGRSAVEQGDETTAVLIELSNMVQQYAREHAVSVREEPRGSSRMDRLTARSSKQHSRSSFNPELSGKFLVLYRLMLTLRALPDKDRYVISVLSYCFVFIMGMYRIVVVSNYTQTLDLVELMCNDNNWPVLRLDGTTTGSKRTKLVDTFNDPYSNSFAFLLSSKAGGCGINLIGGNR